MTSGNNRQIGVYVAKNGVIIPESLVVITTNGTGRAEGVFIHDLVKLDPTDYVEIWCENQTNSNNILVTDLNVIIQ